MKSRKAFYKQHVAKSIRAMMVMFMVSYLLMFGVVLYDSFIYRLPFYYILFSLVGVGISFVYKAIQKFYWNEDAQKITRKRSMITMIFSLGLFTGLMLVRRFLLKEMLMPSILCISLMPRF